MKDTASYIFMMTGLNIYIVNKKNFQHIYNATDKKMEYIKKKDEGIQFRF